MDELDELPVIRIIARQDVAGLDPVFLVQLQGSSKRVRRTRQQLEQEVPQLLKDFLRQHDVVDSPSTSGQDAEKSVVDETDASDASSSEQDLDETSDFDIAREQSPPKPLRKHKQLGPTRTSARTKGRSATSASSSISVSAQDSDFGSEDEYSHGSSRPARQTNRHTRPRQGRGNYHESSGTTASDDDEHDEDELAIGSTVEQRPSTKNTPKPLTTDSDSDDQVEANIEHAAGEPMPIENQHRDLCEKCGELPVPRALHNRAVLKRQRKGRKRKVDEFDLNSDDEEDELRRRGAWVECSVCLVSCHFACLAAPIAKQLVNKLKADWQADERLSRTPESSTDGDVEMQPVARSSKGPRPKQEFDINATFTIPKCGFCRRAGGRRCFECGVSGRKSIIDEPAKPEDQMDHDGPTASQRSKIPPLMFRCTMCKRACHYNCLGVEEGKEDAPRDSLHESYYKDGSCHQCYSWRGNTPEFILAWKPDEDLEQENRTLNDVEEDDVRPEFEKVVKKDETSGKVYEIPSADDPTAAALYLVKWSGLSYRWLEWVPHSFLAARYHQKLANFLHKGSLVEFAAPAEDELEVDADDERFKQVESAPLPDPQAQERLPTVWSLVDRVLDVWFVNKHAQERRYDEYYKRLDPDPEVSVKLVYKAYIKWTELSYEASTIESPPQPGEPGYDRFVAAYKKFIESRKPSMLVPNLKIAQMDELDKPMSLSKFQHVKEQPDFIKNGNLMDFQLAGVSFLYRKWWSREGAVLADEMGLGKTVQVITFLSLLYNKQGARPFLVVVPNSTLGNWAREFERWAPDMRVVAYGGGKESRSIIEQYELFDPKGNLKSHVVLATYEGVEKNTAVFRRVARWDTLIVDEGQRLKGGTRGLLYKALQSLRIGSRVLLTGTPLNNSTGELFNLLRFIDPNSRAHLTELEGRTTDLTTSAIDEIRSTLQKYMLRRTKELVLNLPPLNEIIVPLTMTGLQRKLYTSILERNVDFIASMAQGKKTTTKPRKKALNNVLMELRKLLGHPYLVDQDLERVGPTEEQTFQNFIHASTKLELLAKLLPKLKSQGHKVLIFSQFKLNLNILADFLEGIGLKYLRLDGNTDQLDRQRYINAFQAPDSNYDCFILSTRAGGVGITLTAADTVIMYDADFNPHQDVQAISRAHRIGQTKPVRVLKLVVKGSCEEKIMAAGRDKMRLDYLIIQRVEEKSGDEDLESILQFGAKALFDDKDFEAKAINYTDELIDDLLKKADNPPQTDKKADEGAAVFAQFQVYEAGEVVEGDKLGETNKENLHDFWSDILKKNEEEREVQLLQEAELGGRGRRRKAAQQVDYRVDVRPQASKQAAKRGKSSDSGVSPDSGDEWNGKRSAASSDDDEDYTLPYHMMSDVIIEDSRPAAVSGLAAQGSENRKEKRKDKGTNQDAAQPDRKRRKAHEVADAKARMYAQADRIAAEEKNRQHALDRLGKSGQHRRQRIDRLKKLAHTVEDPYLISCLSEASKSTGDVQVMILQQVEESFRKQYGDLIDGLKRDYQAWAAGDPHVDSHVLMQKPSIANGASELGRPRSRGPFGSPRSINRVVAKAADSSEPSSRDTSRPSSSSGLPDRTQASTSASASASTSTSTLAAAAPEQKAPEKPAKGGGGLLRWFSKMTSS